MQSLKERVLAHPSFPRQPTDLASRVSDAGYEMDAPGGKEVWLDDVDGHWTFYIDADRNANQVFAPNLIVRGFGKMPDDTEKFSLLQASHYGYKANS